MADHRDNPNVKQSVEVNADELRHMGQDPEKFIRNLKEQGVEVKPKEGRDTISVRTKK